jgi:hypothetical protein
MIRKLLAHLRGQWMGALALFLVLAGGSAYAANTIFSEDIVNGEVKSPDIGNNQVYSADVRDDTLSNGGLRSADIANGQVAQADLQSAEGWHEVGALGEPPFLGATVPIPGTWMWTNYDTGHNSAAFYRDPYGRVHLKGLVRVGGLDGNAEMLDDIFQLPAGYRPAKEIEFATSSEGAFARVDVTPAGAVSADPPYNWGSLYLDNLSFRCAPSGSNGCR